MHLETMANQIENQAIASSENHRTECLSGCSSGTLLRETKVSDTIDQNSKKWNPTSIRHLISDEDAKSIMSIPISHLSLRDHIISVTSAYHLSVSLPVRMVGPVSPSP